MMQEDFPAIGEIEPNAGWPDPLVMFDGRPVTTVEQWTNERRPELKRLFEYYMYGIAPAAPEIRFEVSFVDKHYFDGKATMKEVVIHYGPSDTPPLYLLVLTPNTQPKNEAGYPTFLGLNFCGNHGVVESDRVSLTKTRIREWCPGCVDGQATDEGRGRRRRRWPVEQIIDRGYGFATFCHSDLDPDVDDPSDGIHPYYYEDGQTRPGKHQWGTIAAWAWGFSRALDYLELDSDVDARRVATVGHSRLGKTALLAAAFDERFAMAIPLQAGCGGTAPSRGTVGESVKQINDTFPHWFNGQFKEFNEQVERLPFDQHALTALMAPRPVLFAAAELDTWANPAGQFEVLQHADAVYRLLGVEGLSAEQMPPNGELVDSRLGYFIRKGKHSMSPRDWQAFLEFADKWL